MLGFRSTGEKFIFQVPDLLGVSRAIITKVSSRITKPENRNRENMSLIFSYGY